MKSILLAFLVCSLPLLARAQSYRNSLGTYEVRLHSAEGLDIFLDAQLFQSGETGATEIKTAEGVVVSVRGPNANSGSKIRAVLVDNCSARPNGQRVAQPTLSDDLLDEADGERMDFQVQLQGSVVLSSDVHGGDANLTCQPQLALVVDGVWQTDPVNGTHNFNVGF